MALDPQAILQLHEDDMLVVNRPAGLLSLLDGYDPQKPQLRSLLQPPFDRLWIAPRLDGDPALRGSLP